MVNVWRLQCDAVVLGHAYWNVRAVRGSPIVPVDHKLCDLLTLASKVLLNPLQFPDGSLVSTQDVLKRFTFVVLVEYFITVLHLTTPI